MKNKETYIVIGGITEKFLGSANTLIGAKRIAGKNIENANGEYVVPTIYENLEATPELGLYIECDNHSSGWFVRPAASGWANGTCRKIFWYNY